MMVRTSLANVALPENLPFNLTEESVMAKIDDEVRELAERKGFAIVKPWEVAPWEVDDGPAPGSRDWAVHWERAQRFRRELIAEIEARRAAKPPKPKRPR